MKEERFSSLDILLLLITTVGVSFLIARLYATYTLLCAVLRERWGKGVSVVCAWLLPEAFVQRSNIAHNGAGVCRVASGYIERY